MAVHNADIAAAFNQIADLLELQNANPFRVRAYRNAARIAGGLRLDIAARLAQGTELPKIPGIGADLAGKMRELAARGSCELLDRLKARAPPGITELLHLPGLGPKRVQALHQALGIGSLEALQRSARGGRLRTLPGFGEKTEQRLLAAVTAHLSKARRFKRALAAQYAEPFAAWLRKVPGAREVLVAGSYRRMKETVGDLDFLVAAQPRNRVIERFTAYAEVREVLASGDTKASVRLASGIQADLRVVPAESFGAALHYFTGSKAHNIALRRIAQERGLKVNEYGVFRGSQRLAGDTEASVYAALELPWIPPELREDQGEIEAARRGALPRLVELGDLRGDLHVHTRATDGRNTVREMALAAKARGLQYLAITDHSQRETLVHGLNAVRLAKQIDEIERLNRELQGITLLKGIEVDILEDGSLDLPDSILSRLDWVVAAVHSRFNLPRARQTERILSALDHPRVHLLAHPSGRLIDERDPYDVDMQAVIRKARARGVCLELNAQPERLDLSDLHCRMAKDEGVRVCINSDAHAADGFEVLAGGVGQARRGWLERGDVLNARPLSGLRRLLSRRRS
ncbi:MAG: DNA polymerase/3'-5' exonuclease PolX [Betaproteobacteria bacterium]|nr:MAG: DNA polymerase/3'-5' exonuclease PolX [Betaproteobacteria bacterium]